MVDQIPQNIGAFLHKRVRAETSVLKFIYVSFMNHLPYFSDLSFFLASCYSLTVPTISERYSHDIAMSILRLRYKKRGFHFLESPFLKNMVKCDSITELS